MWRGRPSPAAVAVVLALDLAFDLELDFAFDLEFGSYSLILNLILLSDLEFGS